MKNLKMLIWVGVVAGILFISCASTSYESEEQIYESITEEIVEEVQFIEPEPTAEEVFLEKIKDLKLEFTKIPSKIKKNRAFSPYEILITDINNAPVSNFEIEVSLPVKKEGSVLLFETKKFVSNDDGIVSFIPENPSFCAKTIVTACPYIPENLNISKEELEAQTITADFLVESDIVAKGAILFVFEYNENGKSPKNSYDFLSGLRKKGVSMIGNAPISDTEYINASKEKIYKENFEYVGTDYGYLIGGTIKFVNPVEKTDDGSYSAHLIGSIYGIEMKTGNVIYEDVIEYTGSGSNWNKAVDDCKTNLTAKMVDSIMFGL